MAIASSSFKLVSVIFTTSSIIGSNVCECVFLNETEYSASTTSSFIIAAPAVKDELSIANICILLPYCLSFHLPRTVIFR